MVKSNKFVSIDAGATTTCFYSSSKIITRSTHSLFDIKKRKMKNNCLEIFEELKTKKIYMTGVLSDVIGENQTLLKKINGEDMKIQYVSEIDSIAKGALSYINNRAENIETALIASCGTGLCLVYFDKGKITHLGGSAICGGTLLGSLRLMLRRKIKIEELKKYTPENYNHSMDYVLNDFTKQTIGMLPPDTTFSNFANVSYYPKEQSEEEIICSVLNLVSENIVSTASLAIKNTPAKNIIFTGNVIRFPFVESVIKKYLTDFNLYFVKDCAVVARGCLIS